MKNYHLLLSVALLLTVASCKKKESDPTDNPTPAALTCYLTQMTQSNGNFTRYYFDAENRINKTATYLESQGDTLFTDYVYSGKTMTATSNNGLFDIIQTYYLNANGFTDSAITTFGSFGDYKINYTYNSANQAISLVMYGNIATTEIDQEVSMEYTNGNRTKQTAIDNVASTTTITNFEYYLDKPNKAKAFEEKGNYMNANTNMLKKSSTPDGLTFTNYTYDFDTEGNVSQMKMMDNQNVETWNKYIWNCK
jgi:hypothetical protein